MKHIVKKVLYSMGIVMCSMAAFITAHANDFVCFGKYYQPKLPENIEQFKNRA